MKDLLFHKLKASMIHLGISLVIFVGILYLILVQWYPEPFFTVEGGWKGIRLMVAVDLVLGPTLTFIVYNYKKSRKEIIFDLSLVVLVQISALIWGGLQVYGERPVALVMWEGRFYTVTEDYLKKQNASADILLRYSDENPPLILAKTDGTLETLKELQRLNHEMIPPYAQIHLFSSLKDNLGEIMAYKIPGELLTSYLDETGLIDNISVFLARAKYGELLVFLDNEGNLVKLRAIDIAESQNN